MGLDAYLNLDISGELDLQCEIFKLGKRKVFFVGPIPVVVNLFAELNALLNINFDVSLSYPYNCNSDDKCSGDPSLGFAMDTYLTIALGIELGNDKIGLELFSGEFEI